MVDVVLRMGEFLRRNEKQVRESERLLVDGIDVTIGSVSDSAKLNNDWGPDWVNGVFVARLLCTFATCGTAVSILGDGALEFITSRDSGVDYITPPLRFARPALPLVDVPDSCPGLYP